MQCRQCRQCSSEGCSEIVQRCNEVEVFSIERPWSFRLLSADSAPVSCRCCAEFLAENLNQVGLAGKTGRAGHPSERQIGFMQQPLGAVDADAAEFYQRCPARDRLESYFQGAA